MAFPRSPEARRLQIETYAARHSVAFRHAALELTEDADRATRAAYLILARSVARSASAAGRTLHPADTE